MQEANRRYTELVGAVVIYMDNPKALKFRFGARHKWVPKAQSKIDNLRLYVWHSTAKEKQHVWGGAFIKDTQEEKMRSIDELPIKKMKDAAKIVQRELNNIWRAIEEYERARDSEMDETR